MGLVLKPSVNGPCGATLMPTYEYRCQGCQATTEVIRPVQDRDTVPACKECATPMTRQFTAPEIKFTGTGFYSTDK